MASADVKDLMDGSKTEDEFFDGLKRMQREINHRQVVFAATVAIANLATLVFLYNLIGSLAIVWTVPWFYGAGKALSRKVGL